MMEMHLDNWNLTPELALMLDIALRNDPKIPEGLDWEAFEAALRQHRVQPLLIRGLRGMDADTVAQFPVLKKYRSRQNQYTMESFQRLQALAQACAALAAEGIRVISMKGPILSMELYGDPSLRTSRDLDVMVCEDDMHRAGEILIGLGYEQEQSLFHKTPLRRKYYSLIELEKHTVYTRGDICIELHWKSNFQSETTFDELWAGREERMILGKPIAILGADDRHPALVIHAAEHGFHRLRWLLDLYELQRKPGFSWEKLHRQMRAQGVGELLLETILVMYRLALPGLENVEFEGFRLTRDAEGISLHIGDELAEEGRRALALCEAVYPLWQREAPWGDPRQRAHDRLLPTSLIQKSLLQKLLQNFGPSTYELELVDLPDWLFWLYFLIRPFSWLWRKLTGK